MVLELFSPFLINYKLQHMNHSVNTMFLTTAFISHLNNSEFIKKKNEIDFSKLEKTAPIASLFHDIGKIIVPNYILGAPEPDFGKEEKEIINAHPEHSYDICKTLFNVDSIKTNYFEDKISLIEGTLNGIRQHHFPFNHTPQPSIEAQIVALVDSYLAITENRNYLATSSQKYLKISDVIEKLTFDRDKKNVIEKGKYDKDLFDEFVKFLKNNESSLAATKRTGFRFRVKSNAKITLEIYNFDYTEAFGRGFLIGNKFELINLSFSGLKLKDDNNSLSENVQNEHLFNFENKFKHCYVLKINFISKDGQTNEMKDIPFDVFMFSKNFSLLSSPL